MKKRQLNATSVKLVQMMLGASGILICYIQYIHNFDGSILQYLGALVTALYILWILFHAKHPGRVFGRYSAEILVMIGLALSILANRQYSDIYSIIGLMQVFLFLVGNMVYAGNEDAGRIEKGIHLIFLLIIVQTFAMVLLSFFTVIAGPSYVSSGHSSFMGVSAEDLAAWREALRTFVFSGYYRNSNQAGENAYISLMLSMYFLLDQKKHRKFHILNIIVQFAMILICGSRAVLLALIVTGIFAVSRMQDKKVKRIFFLLLLVMIAAGAAAFYTKTRHHYDNGTLETFLDTITGDRYYLWKSCLFMWKTSPLFGIGLANIPQASAAILGEGSLIAFRYNSAHNAVVNIICQSGIVGALCFIPYGVKCLHARKHLPEVLKQFLIGLVIIDQFDIFMLFTDKPATLLFPLIIGFSCLKEMQQEKKRVYLQSGLVEEKVFDEIYTKKDKPGRQMQKFNLLIAEGFRKAGYAIECDTAVQASPAVVDYRFHHFQNNGIYHYSLSWNVPVLKNVHNFNSAFFHTLFSEPGYTVIDVLSADNGTGAALASRLKGMPCAGVVTDLPEQLGDNSMYSRLVHHLLKKCSCYVFLTKDMNEVVNPENRKKWIVMEGLSDSTLTEPYQGRRDRSIIFAGTIDHENGVFELLKAFMQWDGSYDLYYYGDGETEQLKKESAGDSRVHVMGSIANRELIPVLQKASLLMNPRPVHQDFVRYSFPSKLMEYMSVGTFTASSRLACIPEDYFDCLGDLGEGNAEDILSFLQKFGSMNEAEIQEEGRKAQQFVLEKKNNVLQAERIYRLMDEDYGNKKRC